jgi:hypothetical protein
VTELHGRSCTEAELGSDEDVDSYLRNVMGLDPRDTAAFGAALAATFIQTTWGGSPANRRLRAQTEQNDEAHGGLDEPRNRKPSRLCERAAESCKNESLGEPCDEDLGRFSEGRGEWWTYNTV